MKIKIVGPVPEYKTSGSAGADVKAYTRFPITIKPKEIMIIPTGIKMEIPEGYEAQVRPRSGLAAKDYQVAILGTIDSDYRGFIGVIMLNLSDSNFVVHNGDRIGQIVFNKIERAEFESVESLEPTERGEGGFGSTGVSA